MIGAIGEIMAVLREPETAADYHVLFGKRLLRVAWKRCWGLRRWRLRAGNGESALRTLRILLAIRSLAKVAVEGVQFGGFVGACVH